MRVEYLLLNFHANQSLQHREIAHQLGTRFEKINQKLHHEEPLRNILDCLA